MNHTQSIGITGVNLILIAIIPKTFINIFVHIPLVPKDLHAGAKAREGFVIVLIEGLNLQTGGFDLGMGLIGKTAGFLQGHGQSFRRRGPRSTP